VIERETTNADNGQMEGESGEEEGIGSQKIIVMLCVCVCVCVCVVVGFCVCVCLTTLTPSPSPASLCLSSICAPFY